ncbi:helicase [Methanofervidicoccus sp. A16]|uniref:helicase-related protein n=1 Tax=Methanofervidicoccus sp. A16 TaxID=2607662 RepID=UPI00118BEDC7|nr:helicase-related protein [Methanofervidicoccus sp. A16]AXI24737.1 helicase [Methanofervidicoccus sp. A16]
MPIKEGDIVKGLFWDEPFKVVKISGKGRGVYIVGYKIHSRIWKELFLTADDLEKIERMSTSTFIEDPENIRLFMEAIKIRYGYLFNPLLAVCVSNIDPLPHQIEAVYKYILREPRIRTLLADDAGAGKTIMAGLVIKELKMRGMVERILVVAPGHLKEQWRRELWEKFYESFKVIDRGDFREEDGDNPWERYNQVITSIDFAKQEDILKSLEEVSWDLVVVDEAHKMAAYIYGKRRKETDRYKLGKVLSKTSDHLLFLTATPHKGDPENFKLLMDLLMPGFFPDYESLENFLKNRDSALFIRRLKEDLRDCDGRPLFTKRYPITVKFNLSDKELELYYKVTQYVLKIYNKIGVEYPRRGNIAFALTILQRRMASSTYALLQSLRRRRKRLEELLKEGSTYRHAWDVDVDFEDDIDDEERWRREEKWEVLTVAENIEELKEEIKTLEKLIELCEEILEEEEEVKLKELKKTIGRIFRGLDGKNTNSKILIFTESKDTLDYLVEKLKGWGYKVTCIHGGMKMMERIERMREFQEKSEIMVATEAAGEGINLQFCNVMINYDIPWNPNRLEQRMGRIHRYGQRRDVYIFNFVAGNTQEGKVLIRLLEKLKEIRDILGRDRVFDVIGEILAHEKIDLPELILKAVLEGRSVEEEIERLKCSEGVKRVVSGDIVNKPTDIHEIKEMMEKARKRLDVEDIERFFKRAFEKAGGRLTEDGGIIVINNSIFGKIPEKIRKIGESEEFKKKFGKLKEDYPKITFRRGIAVDKNVEFITFGHPLFEAVLEWTLREFKKGAGEGGVFRDPSGRLNGYIGFYIGEIENGKGKVVGRKVFGIYIPKEGGGFEEVDFDVFQRLLPVGASSSLKFRSYYEERLLSSAIDVMVRFREDILEERKKVVEIKEKGWEHFQNEYTGLDGNDKWEKYIESWKKLNEETEKELNLSISKLEVLTVIRVVPYEDIEDDDEEVLEEDMSENREIEEIGMKIAIEFERFEGRKPEDVSRDNLGYDIRSVGKDGEVRYIEVKGRVGEGDVALTYNEWLKAKELGDRYYLYVVSNAPTDPTLYIIRDPAKKIEPVKKVEISTKMIVPAEEWKKKKEKVWKKNLILK